MSIAPRENNSTNVYRRQGGFPRIVKPDLLLTRDEVQAAWELSDRKLTKLVNDGELVRVRRPGYQPYYPMSAVVARLGPPKNDPGVMPTYRRGFDLVADAA